MHIIQETIGKPKFNTEDLGNNTSLFTLSPLPNGYGMTLGNSLRRVLLSSLPGVAITAVKLKGATNDYSTVDGIKDSLLDIILNLKLVRFKKSGKDAEFVTIKKKGAGTITAGDIETSANIEVLNKDFVITEISSNTDFEMTLLVEKGVGYVPVKERKNNTNDDLSEFIFIDANFSPVQKVKYDVDQIRVGDMMNLDELKIEIETDGSMESIDALKFSSNILNSYFALFNEEEEIIEEDFVSDFSRTGMVEQEEQKEIYTPIEILNLSPRSLNALLNAEIGSVEELLKCSRAKLGTFRGFGKKAMDEVSDALAKKGMKLLGD
ncbi:DNA-directed RNA polymerase subunit alpha [Candidatus Gracilibacteria bacterium]|nr:DNA-directed RNA polymerase subunit alpha [Candidatus Gracilibacteria bacterium]